jgi:hypothetical protein
LEEIPLLDEEEDSGAEEAKSAYKKPSPKPQSATEKAEPSSKVQAAAEETGGGVVPGQDDNSTTSAGRKVCVSADGATDHAYGLVDNSKLCQNTHMRQGKQPSRTIAPNEPSQLLKPKPTMRKRVG